MLDFGVMPPRGAARCPATPRTRITRRGWADLWTWA